VGCAQPGYSAAKFGGVGLTQSLALDLAEGLPFIVDAGQPAEIPMFQSLRRNMPANWGLPPIRLSNYIDKVPLKRGCDYQDVLDVLRLRKPEGLLLPGHRSILPRAGDVLNRVA
jgi:sorbitol-6-phosphate 2-dehydrogenase